MYASPSALQLYNFKDLAEAQNKMADVWKGERATYITHASAIGYTNTPQLLDKEWQV